MHVYRHTSVCACVHVRVCLCVHICKCINNTQMHAHTLCEWYLGCIIQPLCAWCTFSCTKEPNTKPICFFPLSIELRTVPEDSWAPYTLRWSFPSVTAYWLAWPGLAWLLRWPLNAHYTFTNGYWLSLVLTQVWHYDLSRFSPIFHFGSTVGLTWWYMTYWLVLVSGLFSISHQVCMWTGPPECSC